MQQQQQLAGRLIAQRQPPVASKALIKSPGSYCIFSKPRPQQAGAAKQQASSDGPWHNCDVQVTGIHRKAGAQPPHTSIHCLFVATNYSRALIRAAVRPPDPPPPPRDPCQITLRQATSSGQYRSTQQRQQQKQQHQPQRRQDQQQRQWQQQKEVDKHGNRVGRKGPRSTHASQRFPAAADISPTNFASIKFMQLQQLQVVVQQHRSRLNASQLVALVLRTAKLQPVPSPEQRDELLGHTWAALKGQLARCKVGTGCPSGTTACCQT